MGVSSATAASLKGAIFALSASVNILGQHLDVWGVISDQGLDLIIHEDDSTSLPSVGKFRLTESFHMTITKAAFEADAQFHFEFDLEIPDIVFLGIDLGSYSGALVTMDDSLDLKVDYAESQWENDGMDFTAGVDVNVVGVDVSGAVHFDVTIKDLEQIPSAIEHYVEDQVVEELEEKILGPLEDAVNWMKDEFNVAEYDVINAMSEAGHVSSCLPCIVVDH